MTLNINRGRFDISTNRGRFDKCTAALAEANVELMRAYVVLQNAKERRERIQIECTAAWGALVMAAVAAGETPPSFPE